MSASTQQSGSFLLDTNIVIAIFAAEQAVLARLGGASAVFVPLFVIGELFFGAYNSSRVQAEAADSSVMDLAVQQPSNILTTFLPALELRLSDAP